MNCIQAALTIACMGWPGPNADAPASPSFDLYDRTAAEYEMFRSRDREERLELQPQSVYKWTAAHVGGASGAVYVWTRHGCAEAVGCFWGFPPANGGATVAHELHSLSPVVLEPRRPGPSEWHPTGKLDRHLIDAAPVPAEKATGRLSQMRALARDFSGYTVNDDGERRELRLLTAPVYRYQSTDAELLDGALFALICTVGTDPEVFLVIESVRTAEGPRWHYALARFGNRELFMQYRGKDVWRSVHLGNDVLLHNADNTYWAFHEPAADAAISVGKGSASSNSRSQ